MAYRNNKKARNVPEVSQQLDRIIVIQTMASGQDPDSGEATETPSTFATVWASVVPWQGREFTEAGQLSAEISTRFHIRWIDGLKATMRVSYDSKIYEIVRIEEIGRHDRVNIYAKAREE